MHEDMGTADKPLMTPIGSVLLVVAVLLGLFIAAVASGKYDEYLPECFSALNMAEMKKIHLNLQSTTHEGIIWRNAKRKSVGIGIRRTTAEKGERKIYGRSMDTIWGPCNRWSRWSEGKYCLIWKGDLTELGRDIFDYHTTPNLVKTLP